MVDAVLVLPEREEIKNHIIRSLSRYWLVNSDILRELPIAAVKCQNIHDSLQLQVISLPDWATMCGINGELLVPAEACPYGDDWQQTDWWFATFLLLECWHERAWEHRCGCPIHSYSYKLDGWDTRAWDAAWVNRIALFLRAWVAEMYGKPSEDVLGERPAPEILVTHDVDAITKTLPIRLKQAAFNVFNAGRHIMKGEVKYAIEKATSAMRFLCGVEDWWTFDRLLELEKQAGVCAQFNFYADRRKKTFKSWLFDPDYAINEVRMKCLMQKITDQGGTVGLHPTFDAWNNTKTINDQREWLSDMSGKNITSCRQHWLRFGWEKTWTSQDEAGIKYDTTLMFNDRPGFRASSAIAWRPWNIDKCKPYDLTTLPTILMDSHLYDYQPMNQQIRYNSMAHWVKECKRVGGATAVLWHPHTLTKDYGWSQGFEDLLKIINEEIL